MPANANTDRSSNLKFKTFILLIASFFFLAVPPAGSQTVWMKYTGNPIMDVGPGTWESKAAAVTCVSLEDTLYKMWYIGWDGTAGYQHMVSGHGTSRDGISWTKYGSQPVLTYGPSLWDGSITSDGYVVHTPSGHKMWYFGQQGNIRRLGYATSTDGTTWTKYPNNSLPDVGLPRSLAQVCITALTVA